MSARRKKGSPMKYRGFYCSDELWSEMQKVAEQLDESDSEYIRKAVEQRNAQYKQEYNMDAPPSKKKFELKQTEQMKENVSKPIRQSKPKPGIQTFFKGEKK